MRILLGWVLALVSLPAIAAAVVFVAVDSSTGSGISGIASAAHVSAGTRSEDSVSSVADSLVQFSRPIQEVEHIGVRGQLGRVQGSLGMLAKLAERFLSGNHTVRVLFNPEGEFFRDHCRVKHEPTVYDLNHTVKEKLHGA